MANNGRFEDPIQQPDVSTGVVQNMQILVNGFNRGSTEVKNLLRFECNVIVECRICRNMFRSFPSFLTHKRIYCKDSAFERVEPTFVNVQEVNDALRPTSAESCPTNETTAIVTNDVGEDENLSQNNNNHINNKVPIVRTYAKSSKKVAVDNRNGDGARNASKFSLNILNRLVKRTDSTITDDENLPCSPSIRYANVNRLVLPTRIENGVHIVNNRDELNKLPCRDPKDAESSSTVTMVVPQDAAHRQHTMALRTRRNFNPATTVKEIDAEDAKIYENLERSGSFDVSTLTCLKCGKIFKSAKSAMFHSVYDHIELDAKSTCYFCGEDDIVYDGRTLKSHMEQHVDFLLYKQELHFGSTRQNAISKTIEDKIAEIASKIAETNNLPIGDDENENTKRINPENVSQTKKITSTKKEIAAKNEQAGEEDEEDDDDDDKEEYEEEDPVEESKPKKNSKLTSNSSNCEQDITSLPKTTWQQRELAKLSASSNLRTKRGLKSPYDSSEFVSSLPKRLKRSPFEYSPTDGRMVRRKIDSPKSDAGQESSSPEEANKSDVSSSSINFDKLPIIFSEKNKAESLAVMDLKALKCKLCGAAFTNKCNLERHCYMHFGFVRFKCSKCDVGAFFRTELRRHLRCSCPNLKRSEANSLTEEKLNSLILAACPEEPGKVTIFKAGPTVWGSSFKGRKKIHYKPALRKHPVITPSFPDNIDESKRTPTKDSSGDEEEEDKKLSELKSCEKVSANISIVEENRTSPVQTKNVKTIEKKDARSEKKSPKKMSPVIVSPPRNRRKENPPKKLIVSTKSPTAAKSIVPTKSPIPRTKSSIVAVPPPTPPTSSSPAKNVKPKKTDEKLVNSVIALDFGKRLQNPMKKYQGSFKKLNMLLAQRRAANEKKSKRIKRLKPSVVEVNSSSSSESLKQESDVDEAEIEISKAQTSPTPDNSEKKQEVLVNPGQVKEKPSEVLLPVRQEQTPKSVPTFRCMVFDKSSSTTQEKKIVVSNGLHEGKMLKPAVTMVTGSDGKVYLKPYLQISAAKK